MPIKRQVLREEVEELLLRRLLESRWAPGSRLSIDGLAREPEVSATPVREAMVSLQRSGLVEYVALRGYVVAPMLDAEQMSELLEARKIIETAALSRSFAQWEDFLADLEQAHALHAGVIARIGTTGEIDVELIHEHDQADWEFHQVFFRHSRNRYLTQTADTLRAHTHRMRQTWEVRPQVFDAREAHAEHEQILERVRCHHHDGAQQALVDHLQAVLARSLLTCERVPAVCATV